MAETWAYGCFLQMLGFIRTKLFLLSSNPTGWESGCSCPRCLMEPYPATRFGGSSLSCTARTVSTWNSSALRCKLLTANKDSKVAFLHSELVLSYCCICHGFNYLQISLCCVSSSRTCPTASEMFGAVHGLPVLWPNSSFNRNCHMYSPFSFLLTVTATGCFRELWKCHAVGTSCVFLYQVPSWPFIVFGEWDLNPEIRNFVSFRVFCELLNVPAMSHPSSLLVLASITYVVGDVLIFHTYRCFLYPKPSFRAFLVLYATFSFCLPLTSVPCSSPR